MQSNGKRGIIIKGVGGEYQVICDGELYKCKARGLFRKRHEKPLAGDYVVIRDDDTLISEILPRKNQLIRPPMANLDIVFIAVASAAPDPQYLYIDKLIISAVNQGIQPVLVVTKSDVSPESAKSIKEIYEKVGLPVFVTSYNNTESRNAIHQWLRDNAKEKVCAFIGVSGVGKSTLMNDLFGLSLQTNEISRKIERGQNTTREVTLFPLSELVGDGASGYIADTPGFEHLDFVNFDFISKKDLVGAFLDFDDYIGYCKYRKCTHTVEEGCAVLEAIEQGKIAKSRHESYVTLYNELKNKPFWEEKNK